MPAPRQRVAEQWNEFVAKVFPPDVGPIQRREMRRAFYAGGEMVIHVMLDGVQPGIGDPTDDEMSIMRDLMEEFREFAKAVVRGDA